MEFLSPFGRTIASRTIGAEVVGIVSFLKLDREAGVDIDARLGIIPTAAAAVGEAASFCTTVIRILGIEDIIDLTHEADSGPLAMGDWQ
jgi:hypothetical protein